MDKFTVDIGWIAVGGVLRKDQDVLSASVSSAVGGDGLLIDLCAEADILFDLVERILHTVGERAFLVGDDDRVEQPDKRCDECANDQDSHRYDDEHFNNRKAVVVQAGGVLSVLDLHMVIYSPESHGELPIGYVLDRIVQ